MSSTTDEQRMQHAINLAKTKGTNRSDTPIAAAPYYGPDDGVPIDEQGNL